MLHVEDRSEDEEVADHIVVTAYNIFRLITCAGCKSVSLERICGHSEDWDSETGVNYSYTYSPPRTYRPEPRWLDESAIPEYARTSLREIYIAVQNDARSLAVMGIRALLEALMIKTVGDYGTFDNNLNAFVQAGHVSQGQKEMFQSTLEVGHAAMHRGFMPNVDALVACMDATEHVIQSLFVFPAQSAALNKSIPKRKKRKSASRKSNTTQLT